MASILLSYNTTLLIFLEQTLESVCRRCFAQDSMNAIIITALAVVPLSSVSGPAIYAWRVCSSVALSLFLKKLLATFSTSLWELPATDCLDLGLQSILP